jgi:hypothetical protein
MLGVLDRERSGWRMDLERIGILVSHMDVTPVNHRSTTDTGFTKWTGTTADQILPTTASNAEAYLASALPHVRSAMLGYNALCFAYGQTGKCSVPHLIRLQWCSDCMSCLLRRVGKIPHYVRDLSITRCCSPRR